MPRKITATSTARTVAQKRPAATARAQPSNGDEENMMEMITILQEFQKRKATALNAFSRIPKQRPLCSPRRSHDDCVRTLLGHYPALVEDLSHRRANQINEASAMLESHVAERRHSRRRLIKNAQARMDENLEHQKIAADATALIKHYKALLLS
ncbi:hypothetical protein A0H81_14345 [Grifola frondosa]|uniref:Uncharacterized protein n=1 Tax=Grifola frondosa TaxID=5627 RepID=A0A1C7LLT5_GRIFR|nr:hypothetical protein A0H81_14345 [Grifola frondosa]